jgi:hypothetical protein
VPFSPIVEAPNSADKRIIALAWSPGGEPLSGQLMSKVPTKARGDSALSMAASLRDSAVAIGNLGCVIFVVNLESRAS